MSDGASQFEICTSSCQRGIEGGGAGQLDPQGVATDSSGDVYVADTSNNRIDEFGGSVVAGTLTEGPPTSATVADGAGYSGQLTVTNASGTVSYSEPASADSSDVVVNSSGAITAATTLAPGAYTVSGTDSDTAGDTGTWGFTLTVTGPAGRNLTQGPATSATVAGGVGYRGQLTVTNATGTVSYTESASADSSDVDVSSTGPISAPSTLDPGTYSVGGTDSDTAGDAGTWSFTFTVTPPATETVCIPDFPAGYLITSYTDQAGCGPGRSGWFGYNAANVALPRNGLDICETEPRQPAPAGHVFTDVFSVGSLYGSVNSWSCGEASGLFVNFYNYVAGYEAMQISQPHDGTIMCLPSGFGSPPAGYVITGVYAYGGGASLGMCGIVFGNIGYNAVQITHPSGGMTTICEPFVGISVPPGYVETGQFNTFQCGPTYSNLFNTVQIALVPQTSTPGVATRSMIASGSGALDAWVTCPASVSSCTGTLNLRAPSTQIARDSRDSADKRATVQTTLATGSVKRRGGHHAAITLKLTASARRLLARKHTIRAQATLMVYESRTTASIARSAATYTSTETVTINETVSPSDAALKARLLAEITPTGKAATITAILKRHGYPLSLSALTGGRVVIAWYQIPKSHVTRGAEPILLATAKAALTHAGTGTTKVALTATGRRLLKTSKRLTLTAEGTFTPTGRYEVVAGKSFSLKR